MDTAMLKFKYNKRGFTFRDGNLVLDLLAIKTVPDLCLFFNIFIEGKYPHNLVQADQNNITAFIKVLNHLKIIRKDHGLVYPVSILTKVTGMMCLPSNVTNPVFKEMVKHSCEKFNELYPARPKPQVQNTPKKLLTLDDLRQQISQNPNQYLPAFHEDYVYSDANWSSEDAKL